MTLNFPIVANSQTNGVIKHNNSPALNTQKQVSFGENPKTKIVGDFAESAFTRLGRQKTPFNRAVIGFVAIATQPWIDLFNKDVDEDTRKTACLRTAAKLGIGTATGIAVRKFFIDFVAPKFSVTSDELKNKPHKSYHDWLKPSESIVSTKNFEMMKRTLSKHREVCGTFVAIAAMMLTDPPLTLLTTNFLNKHFKVDKSKTNNSPKIDNSTKGDK